MRRVASASLLALAGCNQIFGIAPTRQYDASTDVVPDRPHVVLDWQVWAAAQVPASGSPDPTITFTPIVPAPRVRIAPLDGPFDVDSAAYSPDDGSIEIPRTYLNATWRLEYTLAGDVPHEVQWAPQDKQGHLTVPVFGRLHRDPVPTGGGYTITPSSLPSYTFPRVLTTGLWTDGVATPTGSTVDYDFANATSLSGAKGSLATAVGDQVLLVDYQTDSSNCRRAAGSAALTSVTMQPGMHTVQTPTWDTQLKDVMGAPVDFKFVNRLGVGLGKLEQNFGGPTGMLSILLFGAAASTDMPGLGAASDESKLLGLQLPMPVMQTLLQCPYSVNPFPKTAQPTVLDVFPRVLHVQLVDTRQALGVTLTSGMETVIAAAAGGGFTMAFPAAIPMQFKLVNSADAQVDLSGDVDQVAVDAASGPFELSFTPEAAADLRADYYDVLLHRIDAGGLRPTPERIYTVTAPKVRIDGALLVRGADYVFEVRSYKGHPKAQQGDFAPVDYPYGAAIVFTRTFKPS